MGEPLADAEARGSVGTGRGGVPASSVGGRVEDYLLGLVFKPDRLGGVGKHDALGGVGEARAGSASRGGTGIPPPPATRFVE